MNIRFAPNTLYYGDCLDIMRDFPDECVDLICLDPPFNSKQQYHAIFRGSGLSIKPQIKAFDDMWAWDDKSVERVRDIKNAVANPASKVIAAFEMIIPRSQMLSYTSYMAQRLYEMSRVLKDTGSIYLHCDPTASHYLKLIMDAVFGENNFRNEIIWVYGLGGSSRRVFSRKHDTLLFYTKSDDWVFNKPMMPSTSAMMAGKPKGMICTWTDIPTINNMADERLGYPTQKPLALYERIIKASSNPDDLVLDPFAGCGTTIEAALKHNRNVIGIDILPFALRLINQYRVRRREFLPVQGVPVDFETAKQLARDDWEKFQIWSISLINGLAANNKTVSDEGIDGVGVFLHTPDNMDQKAIIVQVTGAAGSQKSKFDELQSNVRNHNAAMGILITRDAQTARRNWSVNLPPIKMGESTYAPMQCFSIEEYYRHDQIYKPLLNLPPLANPLTGKPMDTQIEFELGE